MVMQKQALRKDLQDLLTKYEVDKYTGLHNYMMSEHIVRWIEEYVREQNVANLWSNETQTSYFDYMKRKEDNDVVQPNTGAR
jgi:predicted membrane chloride channel (bestrophin family)